MPKHKDTFKQHVKIVQYMLNRKYPDACTVSLKKTIERDSKGREIYDRWIEIIVDDKQPTAPSLADVAFYVKRFQNGDTDRKGNLYTRSFWVNKAGYGVLGLIRKRRRDNTSTIVERYDPPEKGGPYWLARFEIQKYRFDYPSKKPYTLYDDD